MTIHSTMRAIAVIPQRREVRLVEHPRPRLTQPNQVLVRSLEVGLCGTDKEICSFVYGHPPKGSDYLVLGHESLGEVIEVGDAVEHLKTGDLVSPSVRRPCSHPDCLPCRTGRQDFCVTGDFSERGINKLHGYLTEIYLEEEGFLTFVPAALRDVAVLVEPLTIAEKGLCQAFQIQERFPSRDPSLPRHEIGRGKRAVVLGAGPVGILGAMGLVARGFSTFVYSRSLPPNPKSELAESFGARYLSSQSIPVQELPSLIGNIDLIYEAVGTAKISFEVLMALGQNGIFILTGIPAPKAPIEVEADQLMRNLVLKNQVLVGTVNADRPAFEAAIRDLALFKARWPEALAAIISGRFQIENFHELLLGQRRGIKNVISFRR